MEKRVLIAVFLSFLVIYAYQALVPAPTPQRQTPPGQQPAQGPVTAQPPKAGAGAAAPGTAITTSEPPAPAAAPLVSDETARDVMIENDAVRAVFSSRGAVLKRWAMKRYQENGRQLELIPQALPAGSSLPFTLSFDDAGIASTLAGALYRSSSDGRTVTFEYRDQAGIHARKQFSFGANPFVLTFSLMAEQGGRPLNPVVLLGPALGAGRDLTGSGAYTLPRAIFARNGDVSRVAATDLASRTIEEGTFTFAGVDDHYFMSAILLPRKPMRVEYVSQAIPGATEAETQTYVQYGVRFASTPENEQFFLGPKDFDVLSAIDRNLTRAIDFGMFAWLVVPLLRALKWVNAGVGNYGWSIIILTVLINLVMFPLRHKSVVSMRKLQEIQPQVKAIQDRYAKLKMTDPGRQKMNVEMMNLYREKGVNPASGCVPMVLTFPVLFAFYALLTVAIELRGAPWIGWIRDLSVHDPWYVTPILMGGTMVWQQKLTPMNVDPVQQKIFMFTPVLFTFFFLWAPAGVVLYWLISNVWAIGQQLVTNRLIGPPPQHTVRPPAERRVKKAGSGKSEQAS
jgi:YidC/Oxa1 family membrane protein insertase